MSYDLYLEQLTALKENAGKLMGSAIKDKHVSPEQYARLCSEAIKLGFKFATIEFQL